MFDILTRDFKNAPLWQKILLLILLGFLFYHLFIKSGIDLFGKKIRQFEQQRNVLSRQLQTMQYLVADKNVIEKNYEKETRLFLINLVTRSAAEDVLRRTFKKGATNVLRNEFTAQPEKDFGSFCRSTARFQALVLPRNLAQLLSQVDSLPGVDIKSIDYQNKILNIELWIFYRKSPAPWPATKTNKVKAGKKNVVVLPSEITKKYLLQGFYVNNSSKQVIINDHLFGIGGKCGKYTIIEVDPENKTIRIKADGRVKKIRVGQRF
jgi:hypothetical protein